MVQAEPLEIIRSPYAVRMIQGLPREDLGSKDARGRTICHIIAETLPSNGFQILWAVKDKFPELIDQRDEEGKTPFNRLLERTTDAEWILRFLKAGADPTEELATEKASWILEAFKAKIDNLDVYTKETIRVRFEVKKVMQPLLHRIASIGNGKLFSALMELGADHTFCNSLYRYPHSLLLEDSETDLEERQIPRSTLIKLTRLGEHYLIAAKMIDDSCGNYDQPAIKDMIWHVKLFRPIYYLARKIQFFQENYRDKLCEHRIKFTPDDVRHYQGISFVASVEVVLGRIDWQNFIQKHARDNFFIAGSFSKLAFFFEELAVGVFQIRSEATLS